MKSRIIALSLISIIIPSISYGEGTCVLEIAKVNATASISSNLFSQSGSLKAESRKLLEKGLHEAVEAPAACKEKCDGSLTHFVEMTSVPKFVKKGAENEKACLEKKNATSSRPFKVEGKNFENFSTLYHWIGDFTQGKGPDGKNLYQACDGGCSPNYTFKVKKDDQGYALNASSICGLPRDRNDNTYDVTAKHTWICEKNR